MAEKKDEGQASVEITPELVRQVADEVYKLLLCDLRIERERERRSRRRLPTRYGGR